MKNIIVVGAGFSGSIIARRIAEDMNQKVRIIEKRNHIGGNAYDEYDENGILIQKYGPHYLNTNNYNVIKYLKQFADLYPHDAKLLSYIDGEYIQLPFNFKTMQQLVGYENSEILLKKMREYFRGRDRVPIFEILQCEDKDISNYGKSTHNRRERPVCGHRGRSRGPFYYRITTFGKGPWDARDPHKTTFMALKHVIRLSIWQRQKETPGVEKAPGVSSPQRKESGRSGRDDGELRFGYDPAIHARRLRVYHRPRRLRMASRISIFFAARRFEPLNSMG